MSDSHGLERGVIFVHHDSNETKAKFINKYGTYIGSHSWYNVAYKDKQIWKWIKWAGDLTGFFILEI